jgi:GNAT superfamily N-acetyltransferase
LEELQRRASLVYDDYREALLANPGAIHLPLAQLQARQVRVVELDGQAMGFTVVLPRDGETYELDGLFVEPDHWKRGIGRALMQDAFVLARARGARAMEVLSNPYAEGFYAKQGFLRMGTVQTQFGVAAKMRREQKAFSHALVVGGSGMLARCCTKLLDISEQVCVLARNVKRIHAVAPEVVPVICDYNNLAALVSVLGDAPTPDLIVAWIHGSALPVRRALADRLREGGRLVQVLGSAHADPAHPERLSDMARVAQGLPIDYQAVVLGFALCQGGSRWLTDDEISDGVFAAITRRDPVCIVGTVTPWSARPA